MASPLWAHCITFRFGECRPFILSCCDPGMLNCALIDGGCGGKMAYSASLHSSLAQGGMLVCFDRALVKLNIHSDFELGGYPCKFPKQFRRFCGLPSVSLIVFLVVQDGV